MTKTERIKLLWQRHRLRAWRERTIKKVDELHSESILLFKDSNGN